MFAEVMRANELRIGNWVYELRCDGKLYESQVTEIRQFDNIDKIRCNSWMADSPIPLAEEWLLKFGFDYDSGIAIYSKSGFDICINDDCTVYFYFGEYGALYRHLEHVHQLQNLYFALTGEELTINEQ
jgi:hypothetical protein